MTSPCTCHELGTTKHGSGLCAIRMQRRRLSKRPSMFLPVRQALRLGFATPLGTVSRTRTTRSRW